MREYRKRAVPVKAVLQESPFTCRVPWQSEPLEGNAGDWLISDESLSWPVAADVFAATYTKADGQDMYVKTGTVHAIKLFQPFTVRTLEGETTGRPGDWLVQGPAGEAWPIPWEEFERNYTPVSPGPPGRRPFTLVETIARRFGYVLVEEPFIDPLGIPGTRYRFTRPQATSGS